MNNTQQKWEEREGGREYLKTSDNEQIAYGVLCHSFNYAENFTVPAKRPCISSGIRILSRRRTLFDVNRKLRQLILACVPLYVDIRIEFVRVRTGSKGKTSNDLCLL